MIWLKKGLLFLFLCSYILDFDIVRKKSIFTFFQIKKCSESTVCVCVCVFVQECRAVGEREANWHLFRVSLAIYYSTVASGVCGGSW